MRLRFQERMDGWSVEKKRNRDCNCSILLRENEVRNMDPSVMDPNVILDSIYLVQGEGLGGGGIFTKVVGILINETAPPRSVKKNSICQVTDDL